MPTREEILKELKEWKDKREIARRKGLDTTPWDEEISKLEKLLEITE